MGAEAAQVVGVGTVPAVDGLVGVTHHAEVVSATQPGIQQGELERVDVLELVDVEVPEAPPLGIGEQLGPPAVAGEGTPAAIEQVVEVDHSPLGLEVLVVLEDSGQDRGRQRWVPAGLLGCSGVSLGSHPSGLGPFDLSDHVAGVGGALVAGQERGDHAELAVEQLRLGNVVVAPPDPQLRVGDRVEGSGRDLVSEAQDA